MSEDTKTYLGFDYGSKKIGIAVGQDLTRTARDLDTVAVTRSTPNWPRISQLVSEWRPHGLVVGVPLNSDNEETDMSRRARDFGRILSQRFKLPIFWVNEYLSTHAARQELRQRAAGANKPGPDQIAARLILETFLNQTSDP